MMTFLRSLLLLTLIVLTACTTPEKQQQRGDAHAALGEYDEAAYYYRRAYATYPAKQRSKRAVAALKMGDMYLRLRYAQRAVASYESALRYQHTDSTLRNKLGFAQLLAGHIDGAKQSFQTQLDSFPNDAEAMRGLSSALLAERNKGASSLYTIHNQVPFNGRRADFAPELLGEAGDQLFFTSTRQQATGEDESRITGMKYADIFMVAKDDKGQWKQPEVVSGINTAYDEGAVAFTSDGRTMYLTVCPWDAQSPRGAEIHSSQRSDAAWSKPQKIEISRDTTSSYAHPAPSPDGQWLYFASDMAGGYGGFDLWRARLIGGKVGAVENLGKEINTSGNELFPKFRRNGTLYFSSDGRVGMGGLDLYRATQDSVSNRWIVLPLPAPMNSTGDDFGITFEGERHRGYFSSNRAGGRGWDKLYGFEYAEVQQTIKGWVYEQDGYELPQALVYLVGNDGTQVQLTPRADGSFTQEVQPGVSYVMLATCDGFLNYKQELHVDTARQSKEHVLQFPMASLNIPVLVRNVFYDFDRATLTDSSRIALDRLAALLKENAHIVIELSAHTDSRGADAYNQSLSQRRAESVVRYLTQVAQIAPDRLVARGYGKSAPKIVSQKLAEQLPFLNIGDTLTSAKINTFTPEQQDICHALNRRTEFRVLRTTYGLFDAQGNLRPETLKQAAKPKVEATKQIDDEEVFEID